jgi:hypothetical protein
VYQIAIRQELFVSLIKENLFLSSTKQLGLGGANVIFLSAAL